MILCVCVSAPLMFLFRRSWANWSAPSGRHPNWIFRSENPSETDENTIKKMVYREPVRRGPPTSNINGWWWLRWWVRPASNSCASLASHLQQVSWKKIGKSRARTRTKQLKKAFESLFAVVLLILHGLQLETKWSKTGGAGFAKAFKYELVRVFGWFQRRLYLASVSSQVPAIMRLTVWSNLTQSQPAKII